MVSMRDIRAVGRRIGRTFSPDRVILFGSYAYGHPTEDSDVDLLVIMPFEGHPVHQSVKIRLGMDIPFPADILVRTPRMVRDRLAIGDPFMKDILEGGKVLYESDHRRVGGKSRGRLRHRTAGTASAKSP